MVMCKEGKAIDALVESINELIRLLKKKEMELTAPMVRCGEPWDDEEDENLIDEVNEAIDKIAESHKRSRKAIFCRIKRSWEQGYWRNWYE